MTTNKTAATLAALLAGVLILAGCSFNQNNSDVSDEVIAALTVDTVDERTCEADATGVVPLKVGALEGTPPRVWSDALSTPVGDKANALAHIQRGICEDPLLGSTWAVALANVEVGDTTIGELNKGWLGKFRVNPDQINNLAAEYIPLLDLPASEKTAEKVEEAVRKNGEWQATAQKINTLLNRFQDVGVHSPKSVWNYHLAGGGAVVSGLPEVALNPKQENLEAVILVLTEKGDSCPVVAVGGNIHDKRPEGFDTGCTEDGKPRVDVPIPGKPGGERGTTPVNPGSIPPTQPTTGTPPPTDPGCPPDKPYGSPPNCKDTESSDAGSRGNATQGGGQNRDPQNGGTRTEYTPPPAAPYTPPAQQTTVAPPVTTHETPRTTVPPAETGAPGTEDPGTGCIPAPGKSC